MFDVSPLIHVHPRRTPTTSRLPVPGRKPAAPRAHASVRGARERRGPGWWGRSAAQARAQLVNAGSLSEHGRALDLGAHLILSRGEENTGGRERSSALAAAFEALLGAVFLDGGFDAAREFILREFSAQCGELGALPGIENPKGELQELLQSRSPNAPEYQFVSASGAEHARDFECA